MTKGMPLFSLTLFLLATPLAAQNWSAGIATGPFAFGKFMERTTRIGTETGSAKTTIQLTASVRPGLAADIERSFSDRWAVRLEGTFTNNSQLKVKNKNGGGVPLDAGKLDVTTWMMPIVFNFNRHGAFRVHIFGGPAYASYDIHDTPGTTVFSGSRGRFGGAAGAGVQWWISDDFAAEGNVSDIVTASPLERSDFPAGTTGLTIPKPHNVHTTVGVRYRF